MGKKKKEVLDQRFKGFRQGMIDNGYSKSRLRPVGCRRSFSASRLQPRLARRPYGLVSLDGVPEGGTTRRVHGGPVDLDEGQQDRRALYLARCAMDIRGAPDVVRRG